MEENKKTNKKLYLVIGICVLLVGMFILLNTYAFWRVKGNQSDSNYVVGACLEFKFLENSDINTTGFTLDNTWPMSDEDGINTKGYTFEIENKCANDVDYQVVLEKLSVQNKENDDYLPDNMVKLQFDNGAITTYHDLDDVTSEDVTYDNGQTSILQTKQLLTGTLKGTDAGNNQNIERHNIRMWISSESQRSDAQKVFRTKIKVFAGQGIPKADAKIADSTCFRFDTETQAITGYDKNTCGNDIAFPSTIKTEVNGEEETFIIKKISDMQAYSGYGYPETIDFSNMTGLEEIGDGAFRAWYASNNYNLNLPEGLKKIGTYAFSYYCMNASGCSISLPSSLEHIGYGAFNSWKGENSDLIIPDSVSYIGDSAFRMFQGKDLHLPENIDRIESNAFELYTGDKGENKTLIIPDGVKNIGSNAFSRFVGNDLVLPNELETIASQAFQSYKGENDNLVIPNTVTEIGLAAFRNYIGQSLTISSSVSTIGGSAFQEYNSSDVILPHSITNIGAQAFRSMDSNKKITLQMTPSEYANITKGDNWSGSATVMCILNDVETLCNS